MLRFLLLTPAVLCYHVKHNTVLNSTAGATLDAGATVGLEVAQQLQQRGDVIKAQKPSLSLDLLALRTYVQENIKDNKNAVTEGWFEMSVSDMHTHFINYVHLARHDPLAALAIIKKHVINPHMDFVMFRDEDLYQWIGFTLVFFGIVFFDNFYLFRKQQVLSLRESFTYVVFYFLLALVFGAQIWFLKGHEAGGMWFSGYILEWMLSVDNLFVFRMVFDVYGCPDQLKHKPLFYGIMGAIVFRMIFFVVGEALMHTVHFMHIVFGAFLIYTGVHVATDDDEDSDPTEHPIVVYLSKVLPLVNGYDEKGNFFVRIERNIKTGQLIFPRESDTMFVVDTPTRKASYERKIAAGESPKGANLKVWESKWYTSPEDHKKGETPRSVSGEKCYETRFTFLFIVVVCLEITDLMFAADSVSAIVAQVPDLYLAYTACIFAMLGLRATFFVVDELIRMFEYLKYGVAFMLVFIGVKLIISKVVYISALIVCLVLCSTLFVCMTLSLYTMHYRRQHADEPKEPSPVNAIKRESSHPKSSPRGSPKDTSNLVIAHV